MKDTSLAEYRALAEFRFLITRYHNNTERAARAAGITTQQYRAMLQLVGLPPGVQPTIRNLAERLQIRHHSAVELVDRMERNRFFRRERSPQDRRKVFLYLTRRGERLMSRLVQHRIAELSVTGPALVRSLAAIVAATAASGRRRGTAPAARRA
jgi:DNA-binding MarR family transcriptional regulator